MGLEEEPSTELELLDDFGANLIARFEDRVVAGFCREVCFTICLMPFAIALCFSPRSIQSGLGPKP